MKRKLKKILIGTISVPSLAILALIVAVQIRWDRTFEAPYPAIEARMDSATIAHLNALNAALRKALEDPEIAAKLKSQTLDPLYSTLEQFAERLESDYRKYGVVVKISGAKIE